MPRAWEAQYPPIRIWHQAGARALFMPPRWCINQPQRTMPQADFLRD